MFVELSRKYIYNDPWIYNTVMPGFSDWLNKKFVEWQAAQGRPMSQKDFARWLGVKPTTYSGWVNDDIPPSGENLSKLAYKLGDEVYLVLGREPPSPAVQALLKAREAYEELDPDQQQAFLNRINELIVEVMDEYGAKASKKVR